MESSKLAAKLSDVPDAGASVDVNDADGGLLAVARLIIGAIPPADRRAGFQLVVCDRGLRWLGMDISTKVFLR